MEVLLFILATNSEVNDEKDESFNKLLEFLGL